LSVRIAPSILSADLAYLGDAVARVEAGGADLIHVDVMDGHFVPNLSLGTPVVAALKRVTKLPLDVHLMIDNPDRYLEMFVRAGASMVSVHAEVLSDIGRTLSAIRRLGARAGLAVNPATPIERIDSAIELVDHVLVMSVNPGFSGQSFIPGSVEKVAAAKDLLSRARSAAAIEVDGGVDMTNAAALVRAGANILVAATAIFSATDPADATRALRRAAEKGL